MHRLLPIDERTSAGYEAETLLGREGIKPSFVRLSFDYFISETVFRYLVDAVHFVADDGWKLLPLYRFDASTGLWQHRDGRRRPGLSLHDLSYESGLLPTVDGVAFEPESALAGYLEEARRIVASVEPPAEPLGITRAAFSKEFERLRWFPLPPEPGPAARPA
jgi:hypothetical protein